MKHTVLTTVILAGLAGCSVQTGGTKTLVPDPPAPGGVVEVTPGVFNPNIPLQPLPKPIPGPGPVVTGLKPIPKPIPQPGVMPTQHF